MVDPNTQLDEFPPVDDELEETAGEVRAAAPNDDPATTPQKPRPQSLYRPNASLTQCSGYINQIYQHDSDDQKPRYTVNVSLIHGSKKNDKDEWDPDPTYCFMRVAPGLRRFVETLQGVKEPFHGTRCQLQLATRCPPSIVRGNVHRLPRPPRRHGRQAPQRQTMPGPPRSHFRWLGFEYCDMREFGHVFPETADPQGRRL